MCYFPFEGEIREYFRLMDEVYCKNRKLFKLLKLAKIIQEHVDMEDKSKLKEESKPKDQDHAKGDKPDFSFTWKGHMTRILNSFLVVIGADWEIEGSNLTVYLQTCKAVLSPGDVLNILVE